ERFTGLDLQLAAASREDSDVRDVRVLLGSDLATGVGPIEISLDHLVSTADLEHAALLEEQAAVAELRDCAQIVRHEDDGGAAADHRAHLLGAFALEDVIADAQYLVDYQNVRLDVGGDRESEARVHA